MNILTFEQYIANPTMQPSNVLNLDMVRKQLDNRYDKLINKHKRIKYDIYKTDNNEYFIHVKLPSESYDLFYDVVFKINTTDIVNLKDCKFKVFSNSPSFVFTYAYIFNLYGLFVDELKNKVSKEVLNKEPNMRNYFKIINYEKSIYYSILYVLSHIRTVSELDKVVRKKTDINKVFDNIKSIDEKIKEYNYRRKKETEERKLNAAKMLKYKIEKDIEKHTDPQKVVNTHSVTAKRKISGKKKITGKSKVTGRKKR